MHGGGFDSHHLEPSLYVEDRRLQAVRLGRFAFAVNRGEAYVRPDTAATSYRATVMPSWPVASSTSKPSMVPLIWCLAGAVRKKSENFGGLMSAVTQPLRCVMSGHTWLPTKRTLRHVARPIAAL